jgi:hypothetical protein
MTWFAWQGYNGGKAVDIAGSQEKEAVALGFHGYGTEQLAETNPNSVNALDSWFVNLIIADYGYAVKAGEQPGGPHATLTPGNVAAGTIQAATSLTGLNAIGEFFSRLTNASTWIRVAEVLLGTGLIIVSLAALAADTPVGRAATKAGQLAKIL